MTMNAFVITIYPKIFAVLYLLKLPINDPLRLKIFGGLAKTWDVGIDRFVSNKNNFNALILWIEKIRIPTKRQQYTKNTHQKKIKEQNRA